MWHFGNRDTGVRPYKLLTNTRVHLAHCPETTRQYYTRMKSLMARFPEPVTPFQSEATRQQFDAAFTELCQGVYTRVPQTSRGISILTFYDRVGGLKKRPAAAAAGPADPPPAPPALQDPPQAPEARRRRVARPSRSSP